MHEHRHVKNKKFCPTCDHSHFPHNDENIAGMCLKEPPTAFVVGMQASALQGMPPLPVVRGFYPPVGRTETCSHHTPRIQGEA